MRKPTSSDANKATAQPLALVAEGPFFAQLWESVLDDERLCANAIVLYAKLQRMQAREGRYATMPSQRVLAERVHMSLETVNKCLKELHAAGHIRRDQQPGKQDRIVLAGPFGVPEQPEQHRSDSPNGVYGKTGQSRARDKEVLSNAENTENISCASHTPPLAGENNLPYPPEFEAFWTAYGPTNGPKREAYRAWDRLSAKHKALAMARLPAWLATWEPGYKPYPQKYLNRGIWENEPIPPVPRPPLPSRNGRRASAEDFAHLVGTPMTFGGLHDDR